MPGRRSLIIGGMNCARSVLLWLCLPIACQVVHAPAVAGPGGGGEAAVSAAIEAFKRETGRRVLTLAGYTGAGYEDPAAMLAAAARILDAASPQDVVINIGATAAGIGAVYALARQRGFITMGIVSSQAREAGVALSPCVDHVFYVPDATWGGVDAASGQLSPTSQAIVAHSDAFVAIGGGDIARDELLAARQAGKPVTFVPADMNHQVAIDRARQRGEPEPTDFKGAVHRAWGG